MKKILLFLFLTSGLWAQVTNNFGIVYQDTITTAKPAFILNPTGVYQRYTVTLWTTTGTDTVKIATRTPYQNSTHTGTFTDKAVKDMTSDSIVTVTQKIIVTTTAKEYLIYDPDCYAIKVYAGSGTHANTVFVVSGKRNN